MDIGLKELDGPTYRGRRVGPFDPNPRRDRTVENHGTRCYVTLGDPLQHFVHGWRCDQCSYYESEHFLQARGVALGTLHNDPAYLASPERDPYQRPDPDI